MPVKPLKPAQLRRVCKDTHFKFKTTADIDVERTIIGQPRGIRAIEFGIGIQSEGYNIFVLGDQGTGRATTIKRFLRKSTKDEAVPDDWVLVHNFAVDHQPRAIEFPPGQGKAFQADMKTLIEWVDDALTKAFDNDTFREAFDKKAKSFKTKQDLMLKSLQKKATKKNMSIVSTQNGLVVNPTHEGKAMTREHYDALPEEEQEVVDKTRTEFTDQLNDLMLQLRQLDEQAHDAIEKLEREVAENAIEHHFDALRDKYEKSDEVRLYLEEVRLDVLTHVVEFVPSERKEGEYDWRRYEVNVLVDNTETMGAPVIFEPNPTFYNLIGRIEYELTQTSMETHFTNIKAGSLHRANGGYLLMNAMDVLRNGGAWEALKRALREEEVRIQTPDQAFDTQRVLAKSLDPEPIPLDVKIVLLGNANLYYTLYEQEEDFGELFKVKADFDSIMARTDENEFAYARFVAQLCEEEKLLHFDPSGVEKIVEFGSRLADSQKKLSTRFGNVADLVRESSFWAGHEGRKFVSGKDVQAALKERTYRSNRIEERMKDRIHSGTIMIDTDGGVVGQVNGLSVLDYGDHRFGEPDRLTAVTYAGDRGVMHIDRETSMAGPIHNKGLLTLIGYMGDKYAQKESLSFSASISFEQTYGGVDGDSASSTELYALLSSIADVPIKQSFAVTGSINQKGEIQPIGGATEKIEGFYDVCVERGLTGDQGVLIPAQNVEDLMLREDIVAAAKAKKFHVWAIKTVDEGLELLTGVPAGEVGEEGNFPEESLHGKVQARLAEWANRGSDDEDEDEEEASDEETSDKAKSEKEEDAKK